MTYEELLALARRFADQPLSTIERDLRHAMENFKALCESTIPAHV